MKDTAVLKTDLELIMLPNEVLRSDNLQLSVKSCEWNDGIGSTIIFEVNKNSEQEQPKQEVDNSKMTDVSALKWLNTTPLVEALGCVRTDIDGDVITISTCEDEQPKHTKVEYVKVETVFDLNRDDMNSGIYGWLDDDKEFHPTYFEPECVNTLTKSRLYKKIVTELTERELVIEQAKEVLKCGYCDNDIGKLYDLGVLKLIEE